MKKKKIPSPSFVNAFVFAALAVPLVSSTGLAVNSTWQTTAAGTTPWATVGNWASGTAAGGSSGDVADLSKASLAGVVTVTLAAPTTLGGLNIGTSGGTGTYTLSNSGGGSFTFDNGSSNAFINVVSTSKGDTISAPMTIAGNGFLDVTNNSSSNFTVSGVVGGAGSVSFASTAGEVSSSGQTFGNTLGQVILTATNTYSGDTRVLSGDVVLKPAVGSATDGSMFGTSTNAILLGGATGVQSARIVLQPTSGVSTLNRNITVQAGSAGYAGLYDAAGNDTMSGNMVLNKSVLLSTANALTLSLTGTISSGAGAIGGVGVVKSGLRSNTVTLSGNNTYNGGTIVGDGTLKTNATGSNLGTGNAEVEGGVLQLQSASALAAGKTVLVDSVGQVSFYYVPTVSQIKSTIASTSSGAFAISSSSYTTALDLSQIGNGFMYLAGVDAASAVYSATALASNSDGNYRLGGGGYGLAITNGVVIDGTNPHAQLIVGGSSGNLNLSNVGSQNIINTAGNVTLNGANTYTGGTVVNKDSKLFGLAQASGSPFGSSSGAITLHESTLQLNNAAAQTTTTTVGALAFDGGSFMLVGGTTGGSNTLTVASMTRNNNGTLVIAPTGTGATLGSTAFFKATSNPSTISINGGANTMVAPYYFDNTGNYLTYDATNGFIAATAGITGAGAITLSGTDAYLKTTGVATIAASGTISALSLAGNLTSTGAAHTLKITSGGGEYGRCERRC